RSGIRRGGGHIHRIHNRDYGYRLPRKALQTATRMALASKVRDDEMLVIDDLAFAEPKTKDLVAGLKHLEGDGGSLLVTTAKDDRNVYCSARNITGVCVAPANELNALNVLSSKRLLVTKAALDALVASAKAGHSEANGEEGATKTPTKRVTTKTSEAKKPARK